MRSDNEAQPQTIAEEAFSEATERSVKKKRRSSGAKRKAFFFLASRPSGVASERVCVFLCFVSLYSQRNEKSLLTKQMKVPSKEGLNIEFKISNINQ